MTAFAPHTTGIPLNCGKDMEVMKQFYDVSSLLEIFTDFQQIGPTYGKIVQAEEVIFQELIYACNFKHK